MPRVPLPAFGVTFGGEMSSIPSTGVTPSSSLLRTHAPDQIPPADSVLHLDGRSSQVVVSPCWEMDLPDVISAVCVKAPGPVPRGSLWLTHLRLLLTGDKAQRASAKPVGHKAWHTGRNLRCNFHRVVDFGAAVIRYASGSRTC